MSTLHSAFFFHLALLDGISKDTGLEEILANRVPTHYLTPYHHRSDHDLLDVVMYLKFSPRTVALILNCLIIAIVICSWAFVLSAGLKLSTAYLDNMLRS